MTEYIDPEELPFTRDELYQAGCRFLSQTQARLMADHLTECGPDLVATRAERRAGWRAAGIPNAEHMPLYGWVYAAELLPALAALSPEVAERVARLRRTLGRDDRDRAV